VAKTPTHNFRIPLDVWAMVEHEARRRERIEGTWNYPRTAIVVAAIRYYLGTRSNVAPDTSGEDTCDHTG
jgi:hypothetical protein